MPKQVTLGMVEKMCELPKSLGKMKQNVNEYMMLHRMKTMGLIAKDINGIWDITVAGDRVLKELQERLEKRLK